MAHGLVQKHATEGVAHDHRHLAAGRIDRVERDHRLTRRALGHLGGIALEDLEPHVAAKRLVAGLDPALAPRHDLGAEPHTCAVVGRGDAVGVEDLDYAAVLGVAHHHLRNRGVVRTGALVALAQELCLAARVDRLGTFADRVHFGTGRRLQRCDLAWVATADCLRYRFGHAQQVVLAQAVDVAEVGRVALHYAYAGAALAAGLGALDLRVVYPQAEAIAVLGIDLAEVAAVRQGAFEHTLGELVADQCHSSSGTS